MGKVAGRKRRRKEGRHVTIRQTYQYHLLMLPGFIILFIYTMIPFFGNIMAFQNYQPIMGFLKSKWVGLANFKHMLLLPDTARIFRNSFTIAVGKLVLTMVLSIFFAILLNEITSVKFKKSVQTICFLPHFLSWVILATIFKNLLDTGGILNQGLMSLGILKEPLMFLGSNKLFQGVVISTDVWKEFGYGAIIFIAALMGINPELYEAASVDGAGRLAKIWHITLPGIAPTIILLFIMNIGNILNAGFEQQLLIGNPLTKEVYENIDTYVYRYGVQIGRYSFATAVGLMKSVIGFALVMIANKISAKVTDMRLF